MYYIRCSRVMFEPATFPILFYCRSQLKPTLACQLSAVCIGNSREKTYFLVYHIIMFMRRSYNGSQLITSSVLTWTNSDLYMYIPLNRTLHWRRGKHIQDGHYGLCTVQPYYTGWIQKRNPNVNWYISKILTL